MAQTPTPPPPPGPDELRKRLCGELARNATTPEGLARLQLLYAGALRAQQPTPAPEPAGTPSGGPGDARPREGGQLPPTAFLAPSDLGDLAADGAPRDPAAGGAPRARPAPAPPPRRRRRSAPAPPLRVCLLGESAAAGLFYRPHVTPALLLERHLRALLGPAPVEVLDLARSAQTAGDLETSAAAALALRPSLLLVFAGNNWVWSGWAPDLAEGAAGDLDGCRETAAALTGQGVAGLEALAEQRQRDRAGRTLAALAGLARAAGVPLVWVVPEVNLSDVAVDHPVYWIPGDGVRRWYRTRDRSRRLLARGEAAAAARAAARLIALDGGACATSHELLARAHQKMGRHDSACTAWRAQVDAASWDPRFRRASGVNGVILASLRDGCRRHGLPTVDLPEVFAEHYTPALPGRRLFLDHCHLTLEGMSVAMAAAAAAVARVLAPARPAPDWRRLARTAPPPAASPSVLGLALLQAGLYNANLDYRHWEWIEELLSSALATWPDLAATVRDYLLARAAACSPALTAAARRNSSSPLALDPLVWERSDLGGGLLERLCRLLVPGSLSPGSLTPGSLAPGGREPGSRAPGGREPDRRAPGDRAPGGREPDREVVSAWLAHDPLPASGIELAAPRHQPQQGTSWNTDRSRARLVFRALAPRSTFRFLADARQDLELDLTARLPAPPGALRTATVALSVNGHPLAAFRLTPSWRRRTRTVPHHRLHPGLNRLDLAWPLPAALGDAALAEAAHRLRLGIPADLYPVFGELATFTVKPHTP